VANELIDEVLVQNPHFTTVEDVIAECGKRGQVVGLWPVVFAARRIGRNLNRRIEPMSRDDEVRQLTQELLQELKGSKPNAIAYLTTATKKPAAGEVDEYVLCIAEELIEVAGGIQAATESVKKHSKN